MNPAALMPLFTFPVEQLIHGKESSGPITSLLRAYASNKSLSAKNLSNLDYVHVTVYFSRRTRHSRQEGTLFQLYPFRDGSQTVSFFFSHFEVLHLVIRLFAVPTKIIRNEKLIRLIFFI